ncbi:MBL fold metallo-hydrolase [Pacificoceanicola onchidii]|uniref:arsenate reductase/protein-tyrosine-phosphatase family protein n=1 Tax=Pacificoceanicola onchidii TaxID=2562685 RepID=UPI0010A62ABE|nr:MBL fold metallo-hydrolase [Pacificoceanicola onchidii]
MTLLHHSATGFDKIAPAGGSASIRWLGQAGFIIDINGTRIVIDPYLSDSLAEKYRGKPFPHIRMMPVPIAPSELRDVDWVLCTHGHSDHMDPGTLPALLAANPGARVLAPVAERDKAISRGVPVDRLTLIDAGQRRTLGGFEVIATASAHEELARDHLGRHYFLGYVIAAGGLNIWHSGDTIPYSGLAETLAALDIDLALLPINGRDEIRADNGVPGNLTVTEAVKLTEHMGAQAMLGHHFGMFNFNTADTETATREIARLASRANVALADITREYRLQPRAEASQRVLAVCRGNICRSPTAEGLLRKYLDTSTFSIDSAAIKDWNIGRHPDPRSIKAAADRGLDISGITARQVSRKDFDQFDIILGMDGYNIEALHELRPAGSRARVSHLGAFLTTGEVIDIPDPYDDGPEAFATVYDMIDRAAQNLAHLIA